MMTCMYEGVTAMMMRAGKSLDQLDLALGLPAGHGHHGQPAAARAVRAHPGRP